MMGLMRIRGEASKTDQIACLLTVKALTASVQNLSVQLKSVLKDQAPGKSRADSKESSHARQSC